MLNMVSCCRGLTDRPTTRTQLTDYLLTLPRIYLAHTLTPHHTDTAGKKREGGCRGFIDTTPHRHSLTTAEDLLMATTQSQLGWD
jgi:hypothetical protein